MMPNFSGKTGQGTRILHNSKDTFNVVYISTFINWELGMAYSEFNIIIFLLFFVITTMDDTLRLNAHLKA